MMKLIIIIFKIIFCFFNGVISQEQIVNIADLNNFYKNYVKAQKDKDSYRNKFNQNIYELYFSDDEKRSKLFYINKHFLMPKYKMAFPNRNYFLIKIAIDPCTNKKPFCCEGLAICEDIISNNANKKNTIKYEDESDDEIFIKSIVGGGDTEIAWIANGILPVCRSDFDDNECGVFLEIHRPGSEIILVEKKILEDNRNGYKSELISTKNLCSGRYDLFFVFRNRGIFNLMYVKQFFVKYPTCTCDKEKKIIIESGYNCDENNRL